MRRRTARGGGGSLGWSWSGGSGEPQPWRGVFWRERERDETKSAEEHDDWNDPYGTGMPDARVVSFDQQSSFWSTEIVLLSRSEKMSY
jgi:hypothetical protein